MNGRLAELIGDFQRSGARAAGDPASGFTVAELGRFAVARPERYPEYTAIASRLVADLAAAESAGEIRRAVDEHGSERLYLVRDWRRRAT